MQDSYFFEQLLQGVRLSSLLDTVRPLDGLRFYHGVKKCEVDFRFLKVEPALLKCLEWAHKPGDALQDVKAKLGVQQLASLRA